MVMACASMACAEVVEFPNVKIDVPDGWTYAADEGGNAVLQTSDGLAVRVELVPYQDGQEQAILDQMIQSSGASSYEQNDDGMIEFVGSNGWAYGLLFYETGYALCYTVNDQTLGAQHAQELMAIVASVQELN